MAPTPNPIPEPDETGVSISPPDYAGFNPEAAREFITRMMIERALKAARRHKGPRTTKPRSVLKRKRRQSRGK